MAPLPLVHRLRAPSAAVVIWALAGPGAFGQPGPEGPQVETMTPARIAAEAALPNVTVIEGPVPASGGYEIKVLNTLPPYVPRTAVSGTLTLCTRGPHFFGQLAQVWEEGFGRFQPGVKLDIRLYGTSSVVGSVTWGQADIGVLGEEVRPLAVDAFERVNHHPPLVLAIATGNLDVDNMNYPQVFFVHEDNPLTQLTLAQLDGVFGTEHRRGPANLRTWGDLGLTGEWASRPINLYAWYNPDFIYYLQNKISGFSHRWRSDIRESKNVRSADGGHMAVIDGIEILKNLSQDRDGLAISTYLFVKPGDRVKPLALAAQEGGPYFQATKETLINQQYPLTRLIPAVINRRPGEPLDPKVKEFMRYLLSREGQWDFVRTHRYLPLSKEALELELQKLE